MFLQDCIKIRLLTVTVQCKCVNGSKLQKGHAPCIRFEFIYQNCLKHTDYTYFAERRPLNVAFPTPGAHVLYVTEYSIYCNRVYLTLHSWIYPIYG